MGIHRVGSYLGDFLPPQIIHIRLSRLEKAQEIMMATNRSRENNANITLARASIPNNALKLGLRVIEVPGDGNVNCFP